MQTENYRAWLHQCKPRLAPSSVTTLVTDAKRVERYYGDLDRLFERDRLAGVMQELRYSAGDARKGAPNPSKIPVPNPKSLGPYRQAIRMYCEYREANAARRLPPGGLGMNGTVIGYDPGGNDAHGVARATIRDGRVHELATETHSVVEDVIALVLDEGDAPLLGLGVDTLTCWATGQSGRRPADRWLQRRYPTVQHSIVAPNSLYGSMAVSGMALLIAVRRTLPNLFVTETHPKVLYYALQRERHDYDRCKKVMNECLSRWFRVDVATDSEHEWDAAISALAVFRSLDRSWSEDLHDLPTTACERLVRPCGKTAYVWPGDELTVKAGFTRRP